ncbi:MAG: YjbH domain-containing protein [Candidatus Fervidibacter sp.]|uniref:YjbH domain-containing protein n=1 Tax=Candidatus Fervidibacter sp. TaxID=3100871 RepID=UPI00404B285F
MRSLVLLLSMIFVCARVLAYPTSTNLTPSSEVIGEGEVRLEISTVSYEGLFRSGTERYLFSQFGWRRLEWGLDIYRYQDEDGDYKTRWAFNTKVKVWDETESRPTLAVGILDVGKGLKSSLYAVLGKSQGKAFCHLGFGRFDENERWWLAIEYPLNSQVWFVADRFSGRDGYTSLGIYWALTERFELGIAAGIPNKNSNDRTITLNFSWTP